MSNQTKAARPRKRSLLKDEVQIWQASLDIPTWKFQGLLAADEQERAARFNYDRDRNRFIVRRGILRILSGCYAGVEPESILFSYGKNGKPSLADESNVERIFFNLSHSEGMAIYAFSGSYELGVDIERIRDMADMAKLVERFFSTGEKAIWKELPESQQKRAFFHGWTRKEAFIKASGDGLSYPLDGFEVTLAPDEPAKLLSIAGNNDETPEWWIHDIKPASGFAAALAVKGRVGKVDCRRWMG